MDVKPPTGMIGTLLASGGIVVGSVFAGAYAGGLYQTDPTRTAAARSAGGSLGGLLAALGGLLVGMKYPEWKRVGETTALLSVGLYTAGVAALATAQGAPLGNPSVTAAAPQTLVVSTTGQSLNLHVGDTVYAQLPVTAGASWAWISSNPPVASTLPQLPGTDPTTGQPSATLENDGFTATQTGTTTLTATQTNTAGTQVGTFTLTLNVS
jgi:hypothetical protein